MAALRLVDLFEFISSQLVSIFSIANPSLFPFGLFSLLCWSSTLANDFLRGFITLKGDSLFSLPMKVSQKIASNTFKEGLSKLV